VITLTPRLTKAREQVRQLAYALSFRTIQRNTIKDQRDRLLAAVLEINAANAATPQGLHDRRRTLAIAEAVALAVIVREYDALQQTTDNTYPVQEN
jgi:flagellar basal body-associated protein FliL